MKMIAGNPRHTSGQQSAVNRIVIHATVSPCVRGGARSVAVFFQSDSAGGSAHYVVDPGEVIQCYTERTICWHAPPNTGSIGVELCDPQKGPGSRWGDAAHEAMLQQAARLVRQIAARWDVPLRQLSVADVKAGRRGICGHADVSKAFRKTDHTDPGEAFPWDHFMDLVKGEEPKPVPTPEHDDNPVPEFERTLRVASPMLRGDDVKTWQAKARRFSPSLAVDGWYGADSRRACEAIQREVGMPVTGVVDAETWLLTWVWEPDTTKEKSS
ncbi:N-acetylmuramoyl-L-alanine amidase [Planotetraspora sp. A-T 1434]|uniref:peptidoglycan recognition protein family protein n=1 Tax=Planotetraspora sp. A-T 1434 TaxID=2979219 RepID=UPI0021BE48EC|nr:N-acetylmuramoyl-L-alanine amidase [Planotetraspora sp. A-T 1434]MCT9932459.1 N-acetylmuramoyl-L-alanine amidase [Planotetraspora sp. A-T 1434]